MTGVCRVAPPCKGRCCFNSNCFNSNRSCIAACSACLAVQLQFRGRGLWSVISARLGGSHDAIPQQ